MSTIHPVSRPEYYLHQDSAEYYVQGSTQAPRWVGNGAAHLGLVGPAVQSDVRLVIEGFAPGGRQLVQSAGRPDRTPATDLQFSCPKAVSVLRNLSPALTAAVDRCIDLAIDEIAVRIETDAIVSRRGKGGTVRVPGKLIALAVRHNESRAVAGSNSVPDMHAHVHLLIMHACVREDESTGSIDPRLLYDPKYWGALFRASLAFLLRNELGLPIRMEGCDSFTIDGIPKEVLRLFSKRRQAIERELERMGNAGATGKVAEVANLKTRQAKQIDVLRELLLEHWQAQATAIGFDTAVLADLVFKEPLSPQVPDVQPILDELSADGATFTRRDLIRALCYLAPVHDMSATVATDLAEKTITQHPELKCISGKGIEPRYSITPPPQQQQSPAADSAALIQPEARSWLQSSHTGDRFIFAGDSPRLVQASESEAATTLALDHLCIGQRLTFRKNLRLLGVRAGDCGTIQGVDASRGMLTIAITNGHRVTIVAAPQLFKLEPEPIRPVVMPVIKPVAVPILLPVLEPCALSFALEKSL